MRTTQTWSLASLIICLFGSILSSQAQQTYSLAWNANPESDVVGYRVHVGTSSRQYTEVYETTSPSVEISDLPEGSYYFAVTAVNSSGLESGFSEEASSKGAPSGPLVTSSLTTTAVRMQVTTAPSTVVAFDSSTNLVDWQFFANRTANASGVATLNQTRSNAGPKRFFRVRMP